MPVKKREFKDIKEDLDAVLSSLQSGEADVDSVLKLYKRGQALINEMESYIKSAENSIRKIKAKSRQ